MYFRVLILLLSLTVYKTYGQNVGNLSGKLVDKQGSPVKEVSVRVKDYPYFTITDSLGIYIIKSIPAGNYILVFSGLGITNQEYPVIIEPSKNTYFDCALKDNVVMHDEVVVISKSKEEVLEESANAIDVISTKEAKLQSVDMGQVLAQSKGVNVRRSGGLGSDGRFSLNGLTDDQIRFFVDGVPMQFTAFSNGISNIPVNLVDRIEIYKGVVPINFGADALGGAVNVVSSRPSNGLKGSASYQIGSFNTNRIAANLQYMHDSTGLFVDIGGFYDYALNNYKVDVEVGDPSGALIDTTVRRFHDTYEAKSITIGLGVKNRKWVDELSFHMFGSDYFKEVQNNNIMTVAYGGVFYQTTTKGANIVYKKQFGNRFSVDLIGGYTYHTYNFVDTSTNVYDWYGKVLAKRFNAGEIAKATDQMIYENNTYGRANFSYHIHPNHEVRIAIAPTYVSRAGDERRQTDPSAPDPLGTTRMLSTVINGLQYETSVYKKRFVNMFFVKQYLQTQKVDEILPGGKTRNRDRNSQDYGVGNGLRFFISERWMAKASYEFSTRLPNANEIFGDGRLSLANLTLKPERSHNVNVEFNYKNKIDARSKWFLNANGFIRSIQDMIAQFGSDNLYSYQNVAQAQSTGIEVAGSWAGLKERLILEANTTYINYVNTSTTGLYALYNGDRIPNRPYYMANGSARINLLKKYTGRNSLSLFWNARYIHNFYRGWESAGLKSSKQIIPAQLSNNAGVTLQIPYKKIKNALTAEVQNIANAKIYDNFGIQKPGRAYYLKLIVQF